METSHAHNGIIAILQIEDALALAADDLARWVDWLLVRVRFGVFDVDGFGGAVGVGVIGLVGRSGLRGRGSSVGLAVVVSGHLC